MTTLTYQFDKSISQSIETIVSDNSNIELGLLIGQQNETKSSFISIIPSPKPIDNENVEYKNTKDIDDGWIAEHARQVSKMLYGGINVLGVYLSVPSVNVINDSNLSQILSSIKSSLLQDRTYLTNLYKSLHALIYIRATKQYIIKSLQSNDSKFKQSSDIKFTELHNDFINLTLNTLVPIKINLTIGKQYNKDLFNEIKEIIEKNLYNQIKKSLIFLVDNQLDNNLKLSQLSTSTPTVDVLISNSDLVLGKEEGATSILQFGTGVQQFRSYTLKTESLSVALEYLIHDIINSLQSRVELLMDECESSTSSDKQLTADKDNALNLPRRASVYWIHKKIDLCDYLLDSEGFYECQQRIEELTSIEFAHQKPTPGSPSKGDLPIWMNSIEKSKSSLGSLPPLPSISQNKSSSSSSSSSSQPNKTTTRTTTTPTSSNLQYILIGLVFIVIAFLYQLFK